MNPDQKRAVSRSLRFRILIYTALPVVLMLLIVIAALIRVLYIALHESSLAKIDLQIAHAADKIERDNLEAVTVPGIMALAQENGLFGRRSESVQFARRILELYPRFTGAYFGYETNADLKDREFLNTASPELLKACDANGRFIPYWFRDRTNATVIHLVPLIDMSTSFYYQGVKNRILGLPETQNINLSGGISAHYLPSPAAQTENVMVTEPYEYEGKLIVEQTYPVVIDGKFAGIAGVDRALTEIDEFLKSLKPFRTADLILISRRGRVISATMNPALKTKRIEETPYVDILLPFYRAKSDSNHQLVEDPVAGEEFFYDAAKIRSGDWTLVMRVAKREIFQPLWVALRWAVALSVAGLLITLAILVWLANSVSGRVAAAARVASQVAEGDLTARVEVSGSDETGTLLGAVRRMIDNLNGLIGRVKTSSIQLISTATQISAAAKSQEATVSEFGSSTNQIAAAVNEISATAQELAKTMNDVTHLVNDTAHLATSGRGSLAAMEGTMRTLSDATASISSKLSAISEKARNINGVVTTITKIADQTNLLSLNAAIEAEKAGEYGLGFSVVAREIRRLADQTAVATLDIDQMVKEMQSAVSSGVMEMDKFTDQVRKGVEAAQKLSEQLSSIIEQVQQLTPRFEAVNQGMQTQSDGAKQISDAMLHLTEAARTTSASIQEFNKATADLHDAVRGLREEIAKFKVAA